MNKLWQILLCCSMLTGFFSCKQKVICPAFQSAFIFQEDARVKKFSMFGEDTLPKAYTPYKKLKYGIKPPDRYKTTIRSMATVDMQLVFPVKGEIDSLVYAELNFVKPDSLYADFVDAEVDIFYNTMKKGNVDQIFYNGLYGEQLQAIEENISPRKDKTEEPKLLDKKWWEFLIPKKNEKKEEKVIVENEESEEEEENQYIDDFNKEDFW